MVNPTLNPIVQIAGHQELVLERKDLAPCPLGIVGNLRYTPQEGGTARPNYIGTLLSDLGDFSSYLAFCLTCPSEQARARRDYLEELRTNSWTLGNFLGELTNPMEESDSLSRLARKLEDISKVPGFGLSSLRAGERYCLSTYMDELKDKDIKALRKGTLGTQDDCEALLNQISFFGNDPVRQQASRLLEQIKDILQQRLDKGSMMEALIEVTRQLCGEPMDGQKLRVALNRLADALETLKRASPEVDEEEHINALLQDLPQVRLKLQIPFTQKGKNEDCLSLMRGQAMHEVDRAYRTLDLISRLVITSL